MTEMRNRILCLFAMANMILMPFACVGQNQRTTDSRSSEITLSEADAFRCFAASAVAAARS